MKRAWPLLLASLALHAALVAWLMPAAPDAQTARLGLKTVSVRLVPASNLPAGDGAMGNKVAEAQQTSAPPAQASAAKDAQPERAAQPDDWLPSGRLTRLPLPLDPLDFGPDLAAGFAGRVELVLMVNRHGQVLKVSTRNRDAGARAFAASLTPRIIATRFSPGEVDGVAVNAIVKIAVVSEAAPSQAPSIPPSSI